METHNTAACDSATHNTATSDSATHNTAPSDNTTHGSVSDVTESQKKGSVDPAADTRARLLRAATVQNHLNSEGWMRGGTERLYFGHPTDGRISGLIEIDTEELPAPTTSRLELIAPPEVAEAVIRFVVNLVRAVPKEEESEPVVEVVPVKAAPVALVADHEEEYADIPGELDFEAGVSGEEPTRRTNIDDVEALEVSDGI